MNESRLLLRNDEEVLAALGEEWSALGTISYHAHGTDVLMYGDEAWWADIKKASVERLRSLILSAASELAKQSSAREQLHAALRAALAEQPFGDKNNTWVEDHNRWVEGMAMARRVLAEMDDEADR